MPNGDVVGSNFDREGIKFKLLDAQSATSNGVWVEVPRGFDNKTFESTSLEEGATDATVAVMVSSLAAKPSDATDGITLATLTTVVLGATDSAAWTWIKAKKTAGTTPIATTVTAQCRRRR